jgi:serine/threonine-protein kinase
MRFRFVISNPKIWPGAKRFAVLALWVLGTGAFALFVFGFSFYLAMRVEMRSTEVRVPDLAGLTLETASRKVEPLELVLQVVEQRHDPAVASGRVLQQMPPADSSVRRGRKVKLVLSLGGKVLQVPDLVGQAARAVEIELLQEGFIPGDEARVGSFSAPAGSVIAQVPPAETPAVSNARVHRLVSNGPPDLVWVMPDLKGLERGAAERWIAQAGFRRGSVRQVRVSGRPPGTIVGQLPLAGYPIRSKDVIDITVAR